MKVILTDYVYKHGVAGDVVEVADGFARNYLLPRGVAIKATAGALRNNQHLIQQAAKHRSELKNLENEVAAKIHGVELVFGMKAGKNNKLYGSVTTMDIARALEEKTGVDINRRRISERPLRELGIHDVPIRISSDISPVLTIVIVREEEVAAYLRGEPVPSLMSREEMNQAAYDAAGTSDDAAADDAYDAGEDADAGADMEPVAETDEDAAEQEPAETDAAS